MNACTILDVVDSLSSYQPPQRIVKPTVYLTECNGYCYIVLLLLPLLLIAASVVDQLRHVICKICAKI